MTHHIELLITVVVALFGSTGFWNWLNQRNIKRSADSKLLMGIAYSKIVQLAEKYIERGSITEDEYRELNQYLYRPYAEKGGNGTAARLMAEVDKLPITTK